MSDQVRPSPEMDAGARAEGLCFSYRRQDLFQDLSLGLRPGNIYGLLGRNGAGKSSLLKILAGLLFPQAGKVLTLGFEAARRNPRMLAEVFYLPEEFLLPRLTPEAYLRVNAPFYPRFDREAMDRFMDEFGLDREKKLSAYSYGQKKKFLLSFGLASGCRFLLMDEPTNGLDIPSKSQFRRLVASALSEERIFLISTHQVKDMENLIDPVVILDSGRILFHRTLGEIQEGLTVRRTSGAADAPADSRADGAAAPGGEAPSGEAPGGEGVPGSGRVLYRESDLGGSREVCVRQPGEEEFSGDLELLFNAVISRPDLTAEAFHKEGETS